MNRFNKILMIAYNKSDLGEVEWSRLQNLSDKIKIVTLDNHRINSDLKNTDCLLVKLGATVDKNMIDETPKLKYIGMLGTGFGRIDTKYAASKLITVTNIAGYSTEGVAELAFGLIIEHLREIGRAKYQAGKGDYSEASYAGTEVKNKNFGVIGLGRIGARISEIAQQGFGANVSYWSRNRKNYEERNGIKYEEINSLLKNSDFISLNLAYTKETEKFLNEKRINLIKKGSVVINLAPMELVDIPALQKRLRKNDITFILDHSDELSTIDAKILSKFKNCIMYPPIGYVTKEATTVKKAMFIDNVENYLKGNPTNKIN